MDNDLLYVFCFSFFIIICHAVKGLVDLGCLEIHLHRIVEDSRLRELFDISCARKRAGLSRLFYFMAQVVLAANKFQLVNQVTYQAAQARHHLALWTVQVERYKGAV